MGRIVTDPMKLEDQTSSKTQQSEEKTGSKYVTNESSASNCNYLGQSKSIVSSRPYFFIVSKQNFLFFMNR
jgi:hypothetical protein